jgi:hypothetical protein
MNSTLLNVKFNEKGRGAATALCFGEITKGLELHAT